MDKQTIKFSQRDNASMLLLRMLLLHGVDLTKNSTIFCIPMATRYTDLTLQQVAVCVSIGCFCTLALFR